MGNNRIAEELYKEQEEQYNYNHVEEEEEVKKMLEQNRKVFEENFKKIEETPFTTAKVQDKYYVLLGMSRLSEGFETQEEAEEEGKKITWDKILQVIVIGFNKLNKQ